MNEDRILQQLDKMVAAGQLTEQEAQQLRAAQGTPEFERAVRDVRVRHASERLDAAVSEGQMNQEEADGHLQRLREGEHPRGLRPRLRMHRDESRQPS